MFDALSGNIWTHRSIVKYTDLQTGVPDTASYRDVFLFGLPANHIVLAVKIMTLTSFYVGDGPDHQALCVYVGNTRNFDTPSGQGDMLLTETTPNNTYGMANVTVPSGGTDYYQYGSLLWFTISAPGQATYSRGSGGYYGTGWGSRCVPQRLDAHDVIARFAILNITDSILLPVSNEDQWNLNDDLTSGEVEIAIQYTLVGSSQSLSYLYALHNISHATVTIQDPAVVGEVILLYVNGPTPENTPTVTIGGFPCVVTYAGRPVSTGDVQIAATVPVGATGTSAVTISYDGVSATGSLSVI